MSFGQQRGDAGRGAAARASSPPAGASIPFRRDSGNVFCATAMCCRACRIEARPRIACRPFRARPRKRFAEELSGRHQPRWCPGGLMRRGFPRVPTHVPFLQTTDCAPFSRCRSTETALHNGSEETGGKNGVGLCAPTPVLDMLQDKLARIKPGGLGRHRHFHFSGWLPVAALAARRCAGRLPEDRPGRSATDLAGRPL